MRHSIERELVAVETHAGDGAGGHRADYGTLAELVAGGRVGNMDFHKRQVLVNDHVRGVGESIRIVREGGGVHDHRGFLVGGLVHPVHHFGFVVGLAHLDFEAEVLAPFGAELAQGVEVLTTVDVGLADAETSEVRAIDNDDFGHWDSFCLCFSPSAPSGHLPHQREVEGKSDSGHLR